MEKTLLVIGASSDMGSAAIKALSDDYCCIIAHYRKMNDKLAELKKTLGDKLILVQADLATEVGVRDLIMKVNELEIVPSHILHFPAPVCINEKFHKISWGTYQKEIDISLRSIILVLQEYLPKMSKKKYGRVVLMLSFVVNNIAPAYCCNYVVTKYAMLGLVKSLATEYAKKGITINGISPSWVNTKYIKNQPEILVAQNAAASPIGRNLEVDDIIPGIRYLLSDGAACVNGQNLSITCGR